MSCALAVSSFPGPYSVTRSRRASEEDLLTQSEFEPSKRAECWQTHLLLDIPSVHLSTSQTQLDGDSPSSPSSPLVFRQMGDHGSDWSQMYGRSLGSSSTSPHGHTTTWQPPSRHFISTKDSIASLHLSDSSPAPSYSLLSPKPRFIEDGAFSPRLLPPRTSSLRTVFSLDSNRSMSRSVSPSQSLPSNDSCSERMSFAPPEVAEPEYDPSTKPLPPSPAPSNSLLPAWRIRKLSSGEQLRTDPTPARTLSPSLPERSRSPLPPTNIRVPSDDLYALFPIGGSMGGSPNFWCAPTPSVTPRKPKLKASVPVNAPSPTTSPLSSVDRTAKLSLRRVRKLIARRSVSSLEAFMGDGVANPGAVASSTTLTSNSTDISRLSSETDASADHPDIRTAYCDSQHDGGRIYALKGDVWQEEDITAVLPTLRSLRSAGRF